MRNQYHKSGFNAKLSYLRHNLLGRFGVVAERGADYLRKIPKQEVTVYCTLRLRNGVSVSSVSCVGTIDGD